MEEPIDEHNVVPELYFLIAKFLSGGPLKETAKTLLRELDSVEVLPRRLDWEGNEHSQTYDEVQAQHADVSWNRLASVCERALRLARDAPFARAEETVEVPDAPASHTSPPIAPANSVVPVSTSPPSQVTPPPVVSKERVTARLSLLSDALVRAKCKYSVYKQDHSVVRRLIYRELGIGRCAVLGGRGGAALFPPRLLAGLQLQRRTLGHLSAVYCLVFYDGRYIITGADDLLIKVWSAIDGRLLCTLRGAGGEITDVCISADGALLACGSVERLVRVWSLRNGAPTAVLHAHTGTITSVHWAPPFRSDVRWLASTSTDGSVAFWTCTNDGQFLSQPVHYVERMRPGACHMICAAWSAGGAFLATGSADHHVRLYCVEPAPRRILEVAVHTEAVDSLSWCHRGLRFVSGSKDGTAALWQLHATQWRPAFLALHSQQPLKVTMVCWDSSDAYVFTAVSDHTIRVWCSRTYRQLRSLSGHSDEVYVLEPHPFLSGVLLSCGHDGRLCIHLADTGEQLAKFHNKIEGQGSGAIFDAKWGSGATIAASDSHGHLLILGLGKGHKLFSDLPSELFFHTDYRPLVRDGLGGALDEQTELPPHLMPPPFLVDVEGAPHEPRHQRRVPGRENLALEQLIPSVDVRNRLDVMIEALVGNTEPNVQQNRNGGVWRGEGVRHTAGSWQSVDTPCARGCIVRAHDYRATHTHLTSAELNAWEMSWYRREMRRRPLMISTQTDLTRPRPRARARPRPNNVRRPPPSTSHSVSTILEDPVDSDSSSESSASSHGRDRDCSSDSSHSYSHHSQKSDESSSSQYSDWQEAGAALAPPARAKRRPLPNRRYSPSTSTSKRPPRAPPPGQATPPEPTAAFRLPDWLTAVAPRKAPYHPQMGDHCLYFMMGHQKYFEAVSEKDVYKVNPRDKPWERTQIYECEQVKVIGIKYAIKPPRVACLKLAKARGGAFTVKYHDMPDVIDFLVLRQQYELALSRRWAQGDRFRCMIDDSWWTGSVLERVASPYSSGGSGVGEEERWASEAASHFLCLKVRWDNGEVERLSPWDLEPIDNERMPAEPGGAVPVLPHELEAALYKAEPEEWPPRGERAAACRAIAQHVTQVMSLSVAEPFVAPVDLQAYPQYATTIAYPIDLATIKARFDNLFYRRAAAAQFDVRYLASNAEQFNQAHAIIVRQARLVTDLLLHIISHWREVDVMAKYHELAASYQSSDDEPLSTARRKKRRPPSPPAWRVACGGVLRQLQTARDAAPFLAPVPPLLAPDYHTIVANPMDFETIETKLEQDEYTAAEEFAGDVRLVFANSRLYNTNKRSRIYSMTVRLSSKFEALWSRVSDDLTPRNGTRSSRLNGTRRVRRAKRDDGGSESWDSDAPLTAHAKGKGVGKKSKVNNHIDDPVPGTSQADDHAYLGNGVTTRLISEDSDSSSEDDANHSMHSMPSVQSRRKRARISSDESSDAGRRGWPRKHTKRRRSRASSGSWSSTSGSAASAHSAGSGRRYESDRSYKPRLSSDDDAPLTSYRQRNGNGDDAGPSNPVRRKDKRRGVSLRARGSPRRYNEDSEDDSVAAISKRIHSQKLAALRPARAHASDHDYTRAAPSRAVTEYTHAAEVMPSSEEVAPVSVSSRGRVRKLTAKARGLLRE